MSAAIARSSSLLAIALTTLVVPAPGAAHEIKHAAMRIVHPWVLETEVPKVPLPQGCPPQHSSAIDASLKASMPRAVALEGSHASTKDAAAELGRQHRTAIGSLAVNLEEL